ncbi:hypothetical protein Tco_1515172 [Tanacetum coccineum]
MHTSKDKYLINTLRFVSAKEETQIYGSILHNSLTSPEMKETKAYKTYIGFASGATHPKKARKFKKPASPKLTTIPVSTEEPTGKSKRVKKPTKKSTKAPGRGVVIRETPEIPLSKKKERVDVARAESWGNDEDDSNNEQESSGEDSDQENDKSDQEEDEEDEYDEEEVKDESVKTPSNDSDDEDETKIAD